MLVLQQQLGKSSEFIWFLRRWGCLLVSFSTLPPRHGIFKHMNAIHDTQPIMGIPGLTLPSHNHPQTLTRLHGSLN